MKRLMLISSLMAFAFGAVCGSLTRYSYDAVVRTFQIAPILSGLMIVKDINPPILMIDRDVVVTHGKAAPVKPNQGCRRGDIDTDGEYLYVCVATDWWRRTPLESWNER